MDLEKRFTTAALLMPTPGVEPPTMCWRFDLYGLTWMSVLPRDTWTVLPHLRRYGLSYREPVCLVLQWLPQGGACIFIGPSSLLLPESSGMYARYVSSKAAHSLILELIQREQQTLHQYSGPQEPSTGKTRARLSRWFGLARQVLTRSRS